jgi:hypothetical protein
MDETNQGLDNASNLIDTESTQEKLLSQSQVNKIVAREKEQAALKAKRDAEDEYQRRLEELNSTSQRQQQQNAAQSRDVDADAIFQQVQERFNQEMQQKQIEQEMARVAQSYTSKISQGRELYNDFEEVTREFDPTAFPQLTFLVAGIDNAADIVYELARNPQKLVTLDTLAQRAPRQAQAELLKLSRSIAENKQALNEAGNQTTPAPLDRLQPSKVSGSNGKQTIRDLRAQPWLRG